MHKHLRPAQVRLNKPKATGIIPIYQHTILLAHIHLNSVKHADTAHDNGAQRLNPAAT